MRPKGAETGKNSARQVSNIYRATRPLSNSREKTREHIKTKERARRGGEGNYTPGNGGKDEKGAGDFGKAGPTEGRSKRREREKRASDLSLRESGGKPNRRGEHKMPVWK